MFFQRRRGTEVVVYYWEKAGNGKPGRQVPLPREVTQDLDDLSDEAITEWMTKWAAAHGKERIRSRRRALLRTDDVALLFNAHMEEHKTLNEPEDSTIYEYRYHFESYIVPYFVTLHGEKNPQKWHGLSGKLPIYLITEKKLAKRTAKKVCDTLIRFGNYLLLNQVLREQYYVPKLRLGKRQTPLSKKLAPKEVLDFAQVLGGGEPTWSLFVLVSYFGSLRPEEAFALTRGDFVTGELARAKAKTFARFQKYGLGTGLSIHIDKVLVGKEPRHYTKNHYAKGVVNVWDQEAARRIGQIIKMLPEGPLFPGARHVLNSRYAVVVQPLTGLTAQDYRRASANHLGKIVGVDPILLQDHLRHAVLETTMLYVRDPSAREETSGQQNFDDVG